jgi:hypothetical protein
MRRTNIYKGHSVVVTTMNFLGTASGGVCIFGIYRNGKPIRRDDRGFSDEASAYAAAREWIDNNAAAGPAAQRDVQVPDAQDTARPAY